MHIIRILPFLLFLANLSVFSQEAEGLSDSVLQRYAELNDGPYIFIEDQNLIKKQIIDGAVITKTLSADAYRTSFNPDIAVIKGAKKIAALSDIHGQYDLAVQLLKNNKIIDRDLNWKFGKGHLIIVGDIFDRGGQVNEILWMVYKLEQQARNAGGDVHFTLGNHEFMILHNDLRYIHEKYEVTCALLETEYPDLYGINTVMGRWLRSKSTLIKVNDDVYVHGGISKEFLSHNDFEIEKINTIMRNSIERSKQEMKSTGFYKIYYGSTGLIWYRGYFNDNLEDREITDLLDQIKSKHIVVGHCSNEEVVQLYDHKIYGVDSSIKYGTYGELLLIRKNKYHRKTLDGKKKQFTDSD